MSKLVYPDNGLSSMLNAPFNDAFRGLNHALSNCSFVVPNGFPYLGYLRSLGNKINDFGQELSKIYSSIEEIDKGYYSVFDSLDSNLAKVDRSIIKERSRLIR